MEIAKPLSNIHMEICVESALLSDRHSKTHFAKEENGHHSRTPRVNIMKFLDTMIKLFPCKTVSLLNGCKFLRDIHQTSRLSIVVSYRQIISLRCLFIIFCTWNLLIRLHIGCQIIWMHICILSLSRPFDHCCGRIRIRFTVLRYSRFISITMSYCVKYKLVCFLYRLIYCSFWTLYISPYYTLSHIYVCVEYYGNVCCM